MVRRLWITHMNSQESSGLSTHERARPRAWPVGDYLRKA